MSFPYELNTTFYFFVATQIQYNPMIPNRTQTAPRNRVIHNAFALSPIHHIEQCEIKSKQKLTNITSNLLAICGRETETSMFVCRTLNSSLYYDLLPSPSKSHRSADCYVYVFTGTRCWRGCAAGDQSVITRSHGAANQRLVSM